MTSQRRPSIAARLRRLRASGAPDADPSLPSRPPSALSPLQRGILDASWAALGSMVVFLMIVLVGWLAGAAGAGSGWDTTMFGLDGWLFAHGVPLLFKGESISLIPWLATIVPFGALVWAARRLVAHLPDTGEDGYTSSGARRDVVRSGVGFVVTYTVICVLVAVGARTDVLAVSLLWTPVAAAFWSLVAYVWSLARRFPGDLDELFPRLGWYWRVDVPGWFKRIIRPAVRGAVALLAAGALAAIVLVAFNLPRVSVVNSYVDPGYFGGAIFALVQVAYLPTVATWAVGFAAGPGFSIGEGTLVTWGNASVGPLPLIPVLGALPDPGALPSWTAASVAVPVLVGAWVAVAALRRVGAALPAVGSRTPGHADAAPTGGRALFWSRMLVACSAAAGSAIVTAVVCGFAEGSLGGQRLAHVGVQPFAVGAALLLEMLFGAFVVVALSMLGRARFATVSEGEPEAETAGDAPPTSRSRR